jgi:hypothetical protein
MADSEENLLNFKTKNGFSKEQGKTCPAKICEMQVRICRLNVF